ncbi:sigma-54 interaction domain-containing protein [Rubrivirga marina]|uniref:Sigma-54-dependent Fis family transcriptional regulator n=1 Tax=Rubrivirga marina TaxID=1196024 RepID=A0A271IZ39_9BACT|nr:sigma-54 dependent transcriptional regulator [Rubrivirga marina]PAP76472.1 sigma-54-dependent Fis family transcriptional regulator [Rubrivirga marina]
MDRQALQERFGILGDSPALRRVLERVRQVAPPDITVLLEGESGVGKELIATAIHGLSKRRHKRLVVVNCGAIPEGLIESELFGAEKGAYTGATDRRTGYFEEADGGTLFLDEIGEMPLQAQVRLLRVLETGQFSRVGGTATLQSDARVIAATNKDLGEEVGAGRFREDLYYRLSTVVLKVPSLRERREDIVPLFEAFLARFARQYEAPFLRLAPEAADLLRRYNWPGNVRELRNVAEQATVMVRQNPLTVDVVRPLLRGVSASAGLTLASRPGVGDAVSERDVLYRVLLEIRAELRAVRAEVGQLRGGDGREAPTEALVHVPQPDFADLSPFADLGEVEQEVTYEPPAAASYDAADTHFEIEDVPRSASVSSMPESLEDALAEGLPLPTMEEAESALIAEALRRFDGNRRQSAEALGISERTLYRKLKDE